MKLLEGVIIERHKLKYLPDAWQVTSVLGDTVTDTIQSTSGGSGRAQFPEHALTASAAAPASSSAIAPASGDTAIAAGGRRLLHA